MADEGCRVCIVEHHVGVEGLGYFTNCVTDVVAARDAQVEHHKVQQESLKAFHIAGVNMDQGHGSRFTSSAFALGGGLARADIQVGLNAERAECSLDGLYHERRSAAYRPPHPHRPRQAGRQEPRVL
ncbi:SufD family Fe-S cluster assembly protein [Cupriavidus basilensis]